MKGLFNFFYRLRQYRPALSPSIVQGLFYCHAALGYVRGFFLSIRGVVHYSFGYTPLSVGKLSRSIFEKGAAIDVRIDSGLAQLEFLENNVFWPPIALGLPLQTPFLNLIFPRKSGHEI